MRSFLAFEIPADIKQYLSEISSTMSKTIHGVRWVRPQGQHITIKFFGDITENKAEEIRNTIDSCGPCGSVEASLKGIDGFPDKRRPRVIVATIEEGVDIIRSIYHDIENCLVVMGFEKEKRFFTPHITIGRTKTPLPLLERDIAVLDGRRFTIENIIMYKSVLGREGAAYTPLYEKNLGIRVAG